MQRSTTVRTLRHGLSPSAPGARLARPQIAAEPPLRRMHLHAAGGAAAIPPEDKPTPASSATPGEPEQPKTLLGRLKHAFTGGLPQGARGGPVLLPRPSVADRQRPRLLHSHPGGKMDKQRLAALGMGAFASYGVISNVNYGTALAISWLVSRPGGGVLGPCGPATPPAGGAAAWRGVWRRMPDCLPSMLPCLQLTLLRPQGPPCSWGHSHCTVVLGLGCRVS